jgi:F-type H+-transporting ATPase subunit b
MQVVENVALISINATMLVQLVSFLIFMVVFNRIMIHPLRKVMAEREDYMVAARQRIVDIDQSYEDIFRQIKTQESEARKAAFDMRAEIEETGNLSVKDLMAKTKREINDLRISAQKETDAKITQARESISSEADTLADQMISSLLGRRSLK